MPEDVFSRIVGDEIRGDTLVVGGVGEPTAHPRFIEYSKRLNHDNMELTSNAFKWDDETIQTMITHYKKVTVSVDGLPDSFFAARGFEFDVMTGNVRRLIEARKAAGKQTPVINAMLVLSKDNFDDVKALLPVLKKAGFARLIVSNLLPQTEEDKSKIIYTPYLDTELRKSVHRWYPAASAAGIPMKIPMTKFSAEHRCAFVENEAIFITAQGNLAPCYRFAHDGQEFVFERKKKIRAAYFGNILENTLTELWNRDDYIDFRYRNFASRYPSCVDCDYIECCEYLSSSEADCRANEPSCADCLWCRELIECP